MLFEIKAFLRRLLGPEPRAPTEKPSGAAQRADSGRVDVSAGAGYYDRLMQNIEAYDGTERGQINLD